MWNNTKIKAKHKQSETLENFKALSLYSPKDCVYGSYQVFIQ